ncbi:hypothetical protein, partial [Pyxidicoccus xibeiensis]|uniref:hypothetical protein n=1 Tax=Pyxidicoccus xibeiensis TaxID=2906759 RepID=UPI0020A7DA21
RLSDSQAMNNLAVPDLEKWRKALEALKAGPELTPETDFEISSEEDADHYSITQLKSGSFLVRYRQLGWDMKIHYDSGCIEVNGATHKRDGGPVEGEGGCRGAEEGH